MASFHNYGKLPEGIFALLPGSMYHVHHRMHLVSSTIAHWEMFFINCGSYEKIDSSSGGNWAYQKLRLDPVIPTYRVTYCGEVKRGTAVTDPIP